MSATVFDKPAPAHSASLYTGPERRSRRDWLAATLDEVDYGMLLLVDTNRLVHANHAARVELDRDHPLQLLGRELRARDPHDVAPLQAALQNAAQRGLRKLVSLGTGGQRMSASVVPLGDATTLVILSKRQVCEPLSVQGFARGHGLTSAETRVLVALCQGVPPGEVATELGVGIATVRSQIGSIRQKTGAESIRNLVHQVAVLPPLMSVLRHAMLGDDAASATPVRLIAA